MTGALLQVAAVALLGWGLVATLRHDRLKRRGEDGGDPGFGDDGSGGDCGGDGGGCD